MRSNIDTTVEKKSDNLLFHVTCSGLSTLTSHVPRVWLNWASKCQSPLETIVKSKPYLLNGVFINLIRGSSMTGGQSWVKTLTQEKFGFYASIASAAMCGSILASLFETPYIRTTMIENRPGVSYSLWRFSPTLTSLYFKREAGFSLAVLTKDDLPPAAQYGSLLAGAWFTATIHKFAALEAIRDTLPKGTTIPDFREGICSTVKSMARGGVYTHPVFKVPCENPDTYFALMRNLLHVSCGANMYLFRLIYLAVFKLAYDTSTKVIPANPYGFFNKPIPGMDIDQPDASEEHRLNIRA